MRLKPIIMKIPGKKEGNDNSFLISLTVPKGVEPSSSGRQPDIMNRYTMEPDGRNYWLRSSVSALSAQRSAIELSSCMVGRAGFEPANPEEEDLQSAAFSHLRYLPKYAVHRIRTRKPAGQRFSRPLPHRPDTRHLRHKCAE